jgi:hypothetical protein
MTMSTPREPDGMEQEMHDGSIGDHAAGRACEKNLEQQPEGGREDDDRENPRQEIGKKQLRPGASEIPQ